MVRLVRFQNTVPSMRVRILAKTTFCKLEHPLNKPVPNDFTLLGITIYVSDLHPSKAQSPIEITLSGIMRLDKLEQPINAQ